MKEAQTKQILAYMRKHDGITPMEALNHCGCFRLSARIADLKEAGHQIITIMTQANGKRFARYILNDAHSV